MEDGNDLDLLPDDEEKLRSPLTTKVCVNTTGRRRSNNPLTECWCIKTPLKTDPDQAENGTQAWSQHRTLRNAAVSLETRRKQQKCGQTGSSTTSGSNFSSSFTLTDIK